MCYAFFPSLFQSQAYPKSGGQNELLGALWQMFTFSLDPVPTVDKILLFAICNLICPLYLFVNEVNGIGSEITQDYLIQALSRSCSSRASALTLRGSYNSFKGEDHSNTVFSMLRINVNFMKKRNHGIFLSMLILKY